MNDKKYYLIYEITNNINGKIYIGKHETNTLDDGYMGSGKVLKRAQEKYGIENFTFRVLFVLHNEEEMNLLEKCVVTREFCDLSTTYNLMEGGGGGWDYVNLCSDYAVGSEKKNEIQRLGGHACQEKFKREYGSLTRYVYDNMSLEERERRRLQNIQNISHMKNKLRKGQKHKPETIQKMKEHAHALCGELNPMFGMHWYKDPNSLSCHMFFDGDQPEDWISGRYSIYNDINPYIPNKGKVLIHDITLSRSLYISKENALSMVKSGEWEYGALPMSQQGRDNIRNSAKQRNADYINGLNRNDDTKLDYINKSTNEVQRFHIDDTIPSGFVLAQCNIIRCFSLQKPQEIMLIYKENKIPDGYARCEVDTYNQRQHHLKSIEEKRLYVQETQEMADYFVKYGFEETCKRFPGRSGTCSEAAMKMRFIKARDRYGISFESIKNGRKRTFLPPPNENHLA